MERLGKTCWVNLCGNAIGAPKTSCISPSAGNCPPTVGTLNSVPKQYVTAGVLFWCPSTALGALPTPPPPQPKKSSGGARPPTCQHKTLTILASYAYSLPPRRL